MITIRTGIAIKGCRTFPGVRKFPNQPHTIVFLRVTWFFFRFYHFSEAIIFLSLRTVSFRQQLQLLRVEKSLGKHHLKNYLNETKVLLHRQLLRFSAIPHSVFVPWLYSCILVWILGSTYWTFFSGTHMRTGVQVATQLRPQESSHIGKREDPGDEVWPLPRKKTHVSFQSINT